MTWPDSLAGWRALRALGCASAAWLLASCATAAPNAGADILEDLRKFANTGSVLYVAAHPDDENTQLITYLALGRHYRTAYLSLTRGDGGQNVLGPEFGDTLGVIRTQELLAARHLDGGRQYFSRARDFGFSKDYQQTLLKWDRQEVLSDTVRVIREFRPDLIVTRFSTEPGNTHGHHTASAVLALEAFHLAGDPKAFPEQLATLKPWQPKRILWNSFTFTRGLGPDESPGAIRLTIDGTDPVSGASFATLAARSRSMHQTQGFANFAVAAGGSGPRIETFRLLAGDSAAADLMDGVDTTWGRYAGGAEVASSAAAVIGAFNGADPAASVPALLELRAKLDALGEDPLLAERRGLLDRIIQHCLGLAVQATVSGTNAVPGEDLSLTFSATQSSSVPVRWVGVRLPGLGPDLKVSLALTPGQRTQVTTVRRLPEPTPVSQPYWLRGEETPGMFTVDLPSLIGRPWNPPAVPVEEVFEVANQTLVVSDEAVPALDAPEAPPRYRPLEVVPPASVSFDAGVELFAPGSSRPVVVEVVAARDQVSGSLGLAAPRGWIASPASRQFRLKHAGDKVRMSFDLAAPATPQVGTVLAQATVGGRRFDTDRISINYGHVPPILLQPEARLKAVSLDLSIRGRTVGYIPGAGDSVADALREMGYAVTLLSGSDLTPEKLKGLDAVVVGVRAFNVRKDLEPALPALFGYVESGGTLVEQYNTPGGLEKPQLAPYPLTLSRDLPHHRVTNENAPVTLLAPDHPALAEPNRIGPSDFEGWVQERGLNFPSEWDRDHFTALLACSDPGEAPLTSGLLVARYGRGYFVYTGLSFFRQLPAGVPGAYRLFANLVSLGK